MQANDTRAIPRNPSQAEIRLHCLDLAVRGALLTGRANDFMQQAEQYYAWVMERQAVSVSIAAKPLDPEALLKLVPKPLLRTKAELKAAGVNPADVLAAMKPAPAPADDAGSVDGGEGNQGGGGQGSLPPSLRQSGGGQE